VSANPGPTLYGVNSGDDGLSIIDPVSGAVTFVGPLDPDPDVITTPVSMAVRPSDEKIFVWNNGDPGPPTGPSFVNEGLFTVDPLTGLATRIGPTTPTLGIVDALAFAPDGTLYGTGQLYPDPTNIGFYQIDTATGEQTLIGPMSIRIGGADFDTSGTLYGVELATGTQRLVTIDTSTGVATIVGTLSTDIYPIGSIVFDPTGKLLGSAFAILHGKILFNIDPISGTVSNIRSITGGSAPQGLGFAPPYDLEATIDINPNTLNLKSKGKWITGYIELPDGYDVNDIDISTVRLNDVIPAEWGNVVGDRLMVKFDRSDVQDILVPGMYNLKVTGELTDGTLFEGYSDEITLTNPPKK
jgi:hypothetical protein